MCKYEPYYQKYLEELRNAETETDYWTLAMRFMDLHGYKDSKELEQKCRSEKKRLHQIHWEQELDRAAKDDQKKKKNNSLTCLLIILITAMIIGLIFLKIINPDKKNNSESKLLNEVSYSEAMTIFDSLNGYMNSAEKNIHCETAIKDVDYSVAITLMPERKYDEAKQAFLNFDVYKDSIDKIVVCRAAIENQ